jgi:hypothetical protein
MAAPDQGGDVAVDMIVANNVFAHKNQWGGVFGGALEPGAMVQESTGLIDFNNTYGLDTFNERGHCDFDADSKPDDFIATGVTWWYASSVLGGRWVYLDRSPARLADVTLADVDRDGRCDVTASGTLHPGGGDGSRPLVQLPVGGLTSIAGAAVDYQLTANGGIQPYTWYVSGLPAGLSATPLARITGSTTLFGKANNVVTVTVTSANHRSDTVTIPWKLGSIVPDVVKKPLGVARQAITAAGLQVRALTRVPDLAPVDNVIGQSLAVGTFVPPQSLIDLTLSSGGALVPNVSGMSASEAASSITSLGLVPAPSGSADCIDPGRVINMFTQPGKVVALGTAVAYHVDTSTRKSCKIIK